MKITVFEYASGGGFQGREIPPDILCEGYSMLKSVSEDFKTAGCSVETLLDSRLKSLRTHLGVEALEVSSPSMLQLTLKNSLESSDLSLIVAPETGGVLSSLVASAGESPATPLNSTPEAIRRISDKSNLTSTLGSHGLRTPDTTCITLDEGVRAAKRAFREFSGRVVIKPLDGVGCEGLSLVEEEAGISYALKKVSEVSPTGEYLMQKFVDGIPASVSILTAGSKATPISLNRQNVHLAPPTGASRYLGGSVPLNHRDSEKAFEAAKKAVELFSGLKGYVGVDLILSPEGPILIEVNPRLTVSYTGLRMVTGINLAEAILTSVLKGGLPNPPRLSGVSVFSKVQAELIDLEKASRVGEVLCPPLMLDSRSTGYAFLVVKGRSEHEAQKMMKDVTGM